jgi:hypothetical protein
MASLLEGNTGEALCLLGHASRFSCPKEREISWRFQTPLPRAKLPFHSRKVIAFSLALCPDALTRPFGLSET